MQSSTETRSHRDRQRRQLITSFISDPKDIRYLEQIKREKLFRIQVRFKKCQINHSYRFPRKGQEKDDDDLSDSGKGLDQDRDILYNLYTQAEATEEQVQNMLAIKGEQNMTKYISKDEEKSRSLMKLLKRVYLPIEKIFSKQVGRTERKIQIKADSNESTINKSKKSQRTLKLPVINSEKNLRTKAKSRNKQMSFERPINVQKSIQQNLKARKKLKILTEPNSPNSSQLELKPRFQCQLGKILHTQQRYLKRNLIIDTMRKYQRHKNEYLNGNLSSRSRPITLLQKPPF